MTIDQEVGSRVRALRKKKKLTLKEVAEKLGISYVYLGEMERGEKPWKLSMLSELAKQFHVPLALLQDPQVPLERLERISSVLQHLADMPEEKLEAVERLLQVLES